MSDDIELSDFIDHLISKTKIYEVDNEEMLFCKLIIGDKKDNVPSIYTKISKDQKERGIGKAGGLSIYKLYKETNNEFIPDIIRGKTYNLACIKECEECTNC